MFLSVLNYVLSNESLLLEKVRQTVCARKNAPAGELATYKSTCHAADFDCRTSNHSLPTRQPAFGKFQLDGQYRDR